MPVEPGVHDRAREAYESGRALLDSGDFEHAVREFELSIDAYPHFKALELLGEAWLRKGEPLKALVPLAAATTLNAQVRAPALLAEALLALDQPVDAHRIATLALDRDPNNRKARKVYDATRTAHQSGSS